MQLSELDLGTELDTFPGAPKGIGLFVVGLALVLIALFVPDGLLDGVVSTGNLAVAAVSGAAAIAGLWRASHRMLHVRLRVFERGIAESSEETVRFAIRWAEITSVHIRTTHYLYNGIPNGKTTTVTIHTTHGTKSFFATHFDGDERLVEILSARPAVVLRPGSAGLRPRPARKQPSMPATPARRPTAFTAGLTAIVLAIVAIPTTVAAVIVTRHHQSVAAHAPATRAGTISEYAKELAFSPDGRLLAAQTDASTNLWNVTDPDHPVLKGTISPEQFTGEISDVAFFPDGGTLAVSQNELAELWNVTDPAHPTRISSLSDDSPFPPQERGMALSPDGHTLAAASERGVTLWFIQDPVHPARVATVPESSNSGTTLAFSPDGRILAAASSGTTTLWDVSNRAHPTRLAGLTAGTGTSDATLAFSRDLRTMSLGATLWNIANPRRPTEITTFADRVTMLGLSPDGRTVAAAGNPDYTVQLWDTTDPAHPSSRGTLTAFPFSDVDAIAFSPDGRTLAVSVGATVVLWRIRDIPR